MRTAALSRQLHGRATAGLMRRMMHDVAAGAPISSRPWAPFSICPSRTWTRGRSSSSSSMHAAAAAAAGSEERQYDYDLFTIGAGSGGVRGSRFAASYGAKVAVCELPFDFISSQDKGGVGGTCVLRGCVPKKLMVYASEYAQAFKDAQGFGWQLPGGGAAQHTWTTFMDAKRKELQRLNGAYKNTLKNAGVELLEGRGRLLDAHTVDVDGRRYTAKNILVAVGGTPSKLPIPGADLCITSDEVLELPAPPSKLVVLGAGYIALEFAGIFARMGAEVHVVFRAELPLRGFDEEVRAFAAEQFAATGLHLHSGCTPVEVVRGGDGSLTVVVQGRDGQRVELGGADQVLMATGRAPKTQGLGLEAAGVALGRKGEVVVDEYSRSSVPSVWAVGDVTDRVALTPVALMEGMALAKTLVLGQPTKPDYWAVPSAVFSWPNLACVGLTEEQASARHANLDIYTSSFRPMRNTISGSPLRTFMKLVVDADSGAVLGCHMVGDDAAEIMQGFAVAVKVGVTKEQLDSTVGIHPSAAEELVTMRSPSRRIRAEAAAAAAAPAAAVAS